MKPQDPVRLFVGEEFGPERYVAFFEDTAGDEETPPGGYLYIKDCHAGTVIRHLEIYKRPLEVKEHDIEILWSSNGKKCGVSIWGRMRGIVNLANGKEVAVALESHQSPAITDPEWLKGFDNYLDEDRFIRARQEFWKEMAKRYDPKAKVLREEQTLLTTNFIRYAAGPSNLFSVFEDDGTTGYLYLYNSAEQSIVDRLLLYDRSDKIKVAPSDIWVGWSEDGVKCGVAIWNKMRGIIDRVKKREGRVKVETRDSPGIADQEWLKGFEYLYS